MRRIFLTGVSLELASPHYFLVRKPTEWVMVSCLCPLLSFVSSFMLCILFLVFSSFHSVCRSCLLPFTDTEQYYK